MARCYSFCKGRRKPKRQQNLDQFCSIENVFWYSPEIIPTQAVVPTSTGISNITVTTADNAPAYNLAGQKVNGSYKGIVIKNGKKMVKK